MLVVTECCVVGDCSAAKPSARTPTTAIHKLLYAGVSPYTHLLCREDPVGTHTGADMQGGKSALAYLCPLILFACTRKRRLSMIMSLYLSGAKSFSQSRIVAVKNCGYSVIMLVILPRNCELRYLLFWLHLNRSSYLLSGIT